ncbi:MAG: RNA polymerase sigma factor [Acidobacteria bacterium]|nr:RNA polymerase sigma factor [Acidobacteriota bacterium]
MRGVQVRVTELETIFQEKGRAVFASLVRILQDFDLAEDALQESFLAALEAWPKTGIPQNPTAWLITAGRNKAIDKMRRNTRRNQLENELLAHASASYWPEPHFWQQSIEDDQLRLIFTCCHPAIDPKIQVPLVLREVCGLSTEEIAHAFLTKTTTLAQRLVRGKAKIRDAKIPFVIPESSELPDRLDSVLSVIYLVFNEGYSTSYGAQVQNHMLCDEAIRLARLLLQLLPDPEVMGLLALILLHQSRAKARTNPAGEIILLEEQDRSVWDTNLIKEGLHWVEKGLASGQVGFYLVQAAISAVHAQAQTPEQTDWRQIAALYTVLLRIEPSPVIALNRAVAIAMADGLALGLSLIDALLAEGTLADYAPAHAARGELLLRADQLNEAQTAFGRALALTHQAPQRQHIQKRLTQIQSCS